MPGQKHHQIDYLELPADDFDAVKAFYGKVFDWRFTDYGPEYVAVEGAGIDGGFYKSDLKVSQANGSVLVVFYSEGLEATEGRVKEGGGTITKPIFSFPGGRRFHFTDPIGNEMAVWSDK